MPTNHPTDLTRYIFKVTYAAGCGAPNTCEVQAPSLSEAEKRLRKEQHLQNAIKVECVKKLQGQNWPLRWLAHNHIPSS